MFLKYIVEHIFKIFGKHYALIAHSKWFQHYMVWKISGLGRLHDQGNRLRLLENTMIMITFIMNVIGYIVK